jgi:hypothetical protein
VGDAQIPDVCKVALESCGIINWWDDIGMVKAGVRYLGVWGTIIKVVIYGTGGVHNEASFPFTDMPCHHG